MHTLLATLFTLVFSFSHSNSLHRSALLNAEAAGPAHYRMEYTPSHRELMRAEFATARYAGSACVSCRKMNAVYRVR